MSDGYVESLKLMLAKGADINRPDKDGITPLMEAARYTYRAGSKTTAFLLSRGAKVNLKTKKGNTALIFASYAAATHYEDENVEVVKLLIGKGANVNVRNKEGKTALGIAREGNWKKIAQVLRQAGAKL